MPPADQGSGPPAVDHLGGSTPGFLFADLRGYTRMVDSIGATEASRLLERFRVITRDVVARHGGAEIKTEGDSFYVVLPSASAALGCALDLVAACGNPPDGGAPIPVGVGVHAGEAVAHDGGFVGSAVNIAARLSAEAGAGQVLATATIRELSRSVVEARFVTLGRRTLKGLADPVDIYRVEPTLAADTLATVPAGRRFRTIGGRPTRRTVLTLIVAVLVIAVAGGVWSQLPMPRPSLPATGATGSPAAVVSPSLPSATASSSGTGSPSSSPNRSSSPTFLAAHSIDLSPTPAIAWQLSGPTFAPVLSPPTIAPDGRIWVASGYEGTFLIFDSSGTFLESWGTQGRDDGQFDFVYRGGGSDGVPFGSVALAPTEAYGWPTRATCA